MDLKKMKVGENQVIASTGPAMTDEDFDRRAEKWKSFIESFEALVKKFGYKFHLDKVGMERMKRNEPAIISLPVQRDH
jgi:hypothetical protein